MGLKKIKATDLGVNITYWNVGLITIDKHREEASLVMNGYVQKGAKEFVESRVVSLNEMEDKTAFLKYFKDEAAQYENIYQACYMCAKEMDEFFSDAEDC